MAYPISLGNIVEVTTIFHDSNQVIMNLFHYKFFSGPVITDGRAALQDLMDAMQAGGGFTQKYAQCISQNIADINLFAQWIYTTRYSKKESLNPIGPGLVAADRVSPNLAVAITKRGDLANKHNVGTIHMGGVPNTFQEFGNVTAAGFLAYDDFRLTASASITTALGRVYHPLIFNREDPGASVEVSTTFTQTTTRTMRRRTVGLGI